jgi:drug/metabolite transporter (DMT)-like permease
MTEKKKTGNYILLFIGILCISWSAILVKIAGVTGVASGFYRIFFGTVALLPVWLYYKSRLNKKSHKHLHHRSFIANHDKNGIMVAIICGVLFASDIALWNTSIMLSKASVSTLLANLAPIWVGLGALLFMKEKPGKLFWFGTFIALAGVVVIVGSTQIFNSGLNQGNILAIAASMFYGAYLLTVRKGRSSLDTFSFTAYSMMSSTVTLGIISFASGVQMFGFEPKSWWALIALGLIPQMAGWLTINQALGHIPPTVASVSLLSQTVFTALFSAPVLGEMLTFNEIMGAVVVLTGIVMVNLKGISFSGMFPPFSRRNAFFSFKYPVKRTFTRKS